MKWTMEIHLNARQCDDLDAPHGSIAYLKSYDVDAYAGIGTAELTWDIDQALLWDSPGELLETWRTRSSVRPTRGDGRPNRPLTSYTISPIQVPGRQ